MPLVSCPDCHHEISNAAPACPYCGRPAGPPPDVYISRIARPREIMRCEECREILDYENVYRGGMVYCPCGAKHLFEAARGERPADFSPGVAAILSLVIPGVGQMYRGDVGAGVLWLIAVAIGYMVFVLPGFILHICCIVSAARR